jgi:hypothetical protein
MFPVSSLSPPAPVLVQAFSFNLLPPADGRGSGVGNAAWAATRSVARSSTQLF